MASICGAECALCPWEADCKGCSETNGMPFGEKCPVAECCLCGGGELDKLKNKLLGRINSLGIADMPTVTELIPLRGTFVNMEFTLPSGMKAKLLNDNKIYLGCQVPRIGSERCFGIAADREWLLVCEYGKDGAEAEIAAYVKV